MPTSRKGCGRCIPLPEARRIFLREIELLRRTSALQNVERTFLLLDLDFHRSSHDHSSVKILESVGKVLRSRVIHLDHRFRDRRSRCRHLRGEGTRRWQSAGRVLELPRSRRV